MLKVHPAHLHPALLVGALCIALLAPVAARAAMMDQATAPQDQEQATPAQPEDNSLALAEGSVTEPDEGESNPAGGGETTPPEPLSMTPAQRLAAQRLQSEIFVLRSQAEDFIQQAEALHEIPAEVQRLLSETKVAIAATAGVNRLFDVTRLSQLRDQLLDVPLRLYEAMAAVATPEPGPTTTRIQATERKPTQPRPTQPRPTSETATTTSAAPADQEPAGQEVAPALRRGAQAYFSGNYQRAVEALNLVALPTPRSQALALLLRAAARHALFLNADQPDERQLAVVKAEIQECIRLAPSLRPDPELFSPRFVRFFAESPSS